MFVFLEKAGENNFARDVLLKLNDAAGNICIYILIYICKYININHYILYGYAQLLRGGRRRVLVRERVRVKC